jgi:hypothetical protein
MTLQSAQCHAAALTCSTSVMNGPTFPLEVPVEVVYTSVHVDPASFSADAAGGGAAASSCFTTSSTLARAASSRLWP